MEGFETSVEEVTAEVIEIAVGPEDGTELLSSQDKARADEQRKGFLGMETTPGEDAVKAVEVTAKDLEQRINLS